VQESVGLECGHGELEPFGALDRLGAHLWTAHSFMALGILEDISWYMVCRGSVIARSLTNLALLPLLLALLQPSSASTAGLK